MHGKKKNSKMSGLSKKGKKRARASSPAKQKPSPRKKLEKRTENDSSKKPKGAKTQLIAQELKFARLLANNDKKVRDKVLKNLKKWLMVRSQSSFGRSHLMANTSLVFHFTSAASMIFALLFQPSPQRTFSGSGRACSTACGCPTSPWCRRNWPTL